LTACSRKADFPFSRRNPKSEKAAYPGMRPLLFTKALLFLEGKQPRAKLS
jgi:hypothetical protein